MLVDKRLSRQDVAPVIVGSIPIKHQVRMVELVYTSDLKSDAWDSGLRVRVPLRTHGLVNPYIISTFVNAEDM